MKSLIKLRIKSDQKSTTIADLSSDSTLNDLINQIRRLIKIDDKEIELLIGYPPRAVDMTVLGAPLSQINIMSGDSIILKLSSQKPIKKMKMSADDPPVNLKVAPSQIEHSSILHQQMSMSILITKTIPSDNSCLFASIHYCINGDLSAFNSKLYREMIVNVLNNEPDRFNDALLDNKTVTQYSEWIMNVNNWGGAIELNLLSKLLKVEIDVVNTQYNRVDRFGEDEAYSERILILYDGIHYDALAREYLDDNRIVTKFPIADNQVLTQAYQLANEARSSKQYTDVERFSAKCHDCNKTFSGQKEVTKHAKDTGHLNFGEVNKL